MIDKRVDSLAAAVAGIKDGAVILVGGFGNAGMPDDLVDTVSAMGLKGLTVVSNNAGSGRTGLAGLMATGAVAKIICSYPKTSGSVVFEELWKDNRIDLELVPQGTLSERMRCAGAGLGGFWSPVGVGTRLAEGKETRRIGDRDYVLELPLRGDVALISADRADRMGNLTYAKSARNFGPVMATAADLTIVQCRRFVEVGDIDPEHVITPGIFVDRVVEVRP